MWKKVCRGRVQSSTTWHVTKVLKYVQPNQDGTTGTSGNTVNNSINTGDAYVDEVLCQLQQRGVQYQGKFTLHLFCNPVL
jgi:hypothetical protein